MNNLAGLYQEMGDYARAESLYQRSLKIDEKALGPEHPRNGDCSAESRRSVFLQGDYARAEPLYQRSLKIYEKALGPEHPHTASDCREQTWPPGITSWATTRGPSCFTSAA